MVVEINVARCVSTKFIVSDGAASKYTTVPVDFLKSVFRLSITSFWSGLHGIFTLLPFCFARSMLDGVGLAVVGDVDISVVVNPQHRSQVELGGGLYMICCR